MRQFGLWLACALFVGAGVSHLVNPKVFLAIMPPHIPEPEWMVAISGIAEILGGIGIVVPATRPFARWGIVALLIAVFPANVYMATNHIQPDGLKIPSILLWLRLPLQPLIIWWIIAVTGPPEKRKAAA
jgi:uncharacterized membrane protein